MSEKTSFLAFICFQVPVMFRSCTNGVFKQHVCNYYYLIWYAEATKLETKFALAYINNLNGPRRRLRKYPEVSAEMNVSQFQFLAVFMLLDACSTHQLHYRLF